MLKCGDKNCYDKKGAISARNYGLKKSKEHFLQIYHCHICNWWHLTHKKYLRKEKYVRLKKNKGVVSTRKRGSIYES